MSNENKKMEGYLFGAAIGFLGMGACVALALLIHLIHPYLPAIREFLLWALEERFVMGMVFGMLVAAAVGYLFLRDLPEDVL